MLKKDAAFAEVMKAMDSPKIHKVNITFSVAPFFEFEIHFCNFVYERHFEFLQVFL